MYDIIRVTVRESKKRYGLAGRIAFIFTAIFLLYAGWIISLYLFQDEYVFYPQRLLQPVFSSVEGRKIEDIELNISDSKYLRGWFCKNSNDKKQKLIIYFGGNAEEVSYLIKDSARIEDWALALTNYRGYGQSDGKPGEKELYEDSLRIYDYYAARPDVDRTNIVVMGRSLGTGVATYLASKRRVKAAILISPYESIASIAKERFWFAPVDMILKHRFDSHMYAPAIKAPLLCILGSWDTIVTPDHSRNLIKKWEGATEVHELKGFGHNDLIGRIEVWNYINRFLKELLSSRKQDTA
ncbi:MAG: hypothetical protein C0392_05585 [Syntrophus sp. (in: bacteria)]|nr:hypothetical protein [Syntrophus sp. (in: bacteria)]